MMKRKLCSICVAVVFALAAAMASPAKADIVKWSFGVMADTQGITVGTNTVAVDMIYALNKQFVDHGVSFVVQVGDLTDVGNDASLKTRLDANKALNDAGIAFYGLRGNHESSAANKTYFQANYLVPSVASGATVAISPYDNISYSVTYNNTKIVLLDIDIAGNTTNLNDATTWMNGQLAANDHEQAFVFSHKNLLGQNHKDNLFGSSNDANLPQQNAFLKALADNNVRYSISGHDHMHHRSLVTSPDGQSSVNQLICASDSTKFYTPVTPYSDRETSFAQQLYTIGYYIFTVEGPLVTVDFYATTHTGGPARDGTIVADPEWVRCETFGYSLNGKQFSVASGHDLSVVQDASPFGTGTRMSLSGINSSTIKTYDGRLVYKDINTGWSQSDDSRIISDVLTLWGMEDCGGYDVVDGLAVPLPPTALEFTLIMSYDAKQFTDVYMMQQDRDGNWHVLDNCVDNGDGTISVLVAPGGWGAFALGGTPVPEPATLTLLTLSGLALLRRRR